MDYTGVIIKESLDDDSILNEVAIVDTNIEPITPRHKTPWLTQWTLHTVTIPEQEAETIAKRLSEDLEKEHSWYADYKNDRSHYIIFRGKIFKVDLKDPVLYQEAREYGIEQGIPEYQVDFHPPELP